MRDIKGTAVCLAAPLLALLCLAATADTLEGKVVWVVAIPSRC
jgi:hypothetical protein